MLRQHLRQRQDLLEAAESAAAELRRSMAVNLQSLAWEIQPSLRQRTLSGQASAQQEFIAMNEVGLKAEVQRTRTQASAAVQRAAASSTPVTKESWI